MTKSHHHPNEHRPLWGGKATWMAKSRMVIKRLLTQVGVSFALAGGLNENTCVQMQRQKCRFVHFGEVGLVCNHAG